jgi:hypothetical protein
MLLAPDQVNRTIEFLANVEFIVDDFCLSYADVGSRQIGIPHIHGYRFDTIALWGG